MNQLLQKEILQSLLKEQAKPSSFTDKGVFLSERFHTSLKYLRPDNNIFFSALIVFTLQEIVQFFDPEDQESINTICNNIRKNYHLYKGKNDFPSYNFYKTDSVSSHYPNGKILCKFKHFKLADDADDSCIIALTQETSQQDKLKLHEALKKRANLQAKKSKRGPSLWQKQPVYGVWLGTPKMPIEIDVCVLSNIMYFIENNQFPHSVHEKASYFILLNCIDQKLYFKNPFEVSYSYPRASIILYHLTRFFSKFSVYISLKQKRELIADLRLAFQEAKHPMDQLLCSTSLLKLGEISPQLDYTVYTDSCIKSFGYFIAPIFGGSDSFLLKKIAPIQFFQLQFRCLAYYKVLLLENVSYQNH